MATYATPGVYYERADSDNAGVSPLRTDIAGFVGMAARGPLHTPLPVQSWRQFQAYFGDCIGGGYLAYAVRAFFENGGRRAWIVRIAADAASSAGLDLADAAAVTAWRIQAISPGVWGNGLSVALRATHRLQTIMDPQHSTPDYAQVTRVAGFVRGTHVRIPVKPGMAMYRMVAAVDSANNRLYWVDPDPRGRTSIQQSLTGLDPNSTPLLESVEYTVLVFDGTRLLNSYEDLSLLPDHPRYGPRVLAPLSTPPPNPRDWKLPDAPPPVCITEQRTPSQIDALVPLAEMDAATFLSGGLDGLSQLTVRDFIGETVDAMDDDATRQDKTRGLSALVPISEVALLAIPDIHIQPEQPPTYQPLPRCVPNPCLPQPPPANAVTPILTPDLPPRFNDAQVYQVQAAMVQQCETLRDRFALLDPPYDCVSDPRLGVAAVRAWRKRFDSPFAALYFPWARVVDPLFLPGVRPRDIPPSGHVAGYCASTDLTIGVHKAPANGALSWIQDLTSTIDAATHGLLNDEQIDVLRAMPGRGLRIYGARTLSNDPDWLYINVRRLLSMVAKTLRQAVRWAVFEPNNIATRTKLHLAITSFLLTLWQRGALAGKTPRAAFYVICNEDNNPPALRDNGELIIEVGIAPAIPFEFVVLRVGRVDNEFDVTDTDQAGAAA
ncbi:phage tail sheath family protein [Dyella flagellata]|uniref:Tail sheath protein C-terminal domain-containing protein n=1 Tax=Dyella flagellata TaxID=1867833 RepID=A0ABQ5XG40_9GAMM|nr:phage tail sheath C-terminal domain-containing protein [Dyella flagellata]GLQ89912.1 hypothetical protein GCM10007898_34870 [Dyella flagellata]